MRLPASTTDSITWTGYGGRMSTGVNSLRPVGTRLPYMKNDISKAWASIHPQAKVRGFLEAISVNSVRN